MEGAAYEPQALCELDREHLFDAHIHHEAYVGSFRKTDGRLNECSIFADRKSALVPCERQGQLE